MEPSQFRLGNYVFAYNSLGQIMELKKDGWLLVKVGPDILSTFTAKAVPITADILKSFGFEQYGQAKNQLILYIGTNSFMISVDSGSLRVEVDTRALWLESVWYLHRLQNIIYAITQQEITMHVTEDPIS